MKLEEHCKRTEDIFGMPYKEVHLWLDEFAKNYSLQNRYKHRKYRHHLEGILEAKWKFGKAGMLVAFLHVYDDNDGIIPSKNSYDTSEYEDNY
jgi:hypothetical protein